MLVICSIFLQVFGKGSGKDCRIHAQKLNALRAERDGCNVTDDQFLAFLAVSQQKTICQQVDYHNVNQSLSEEAHSYNAYQFTSQQVCSSVNTSRKWDKYLDNEVDDEEEEDNRNLLEGPRFQKRKKRKLSDETESVDSNNTFKNASIVAPEMIPPKLALNEKNHHVKNRNSSNTQYQKSEDYCRLSKVIDNFNQGEETLHVKNNFPLSNTSIHKSSDFKSIGSNSISDKSLVRKKTTVSKWSKYVDIENDDYERETLDGENVNTHEQEQNASYITRLESFENPVFPFKLPTAKLATSAVQTFGNIDFDNTAESRLSKNHRKAKNNDLLVSLFELTEGAENSKSYSSTSDIVPTSTSPILPNLTFEIPSKKVEEPKTAQKKTLGLFEADDDFLDQITDDF